MGINEHSVGGQAATMTTCKRNISASLVISGILLSCVPAFAQTSPGAAEASDTSPAPDTAGTSQIESAAETKAATDAAGTSPAPEATATASSELPVDAKTEAKEFSKADFRPQDIKLAERANARWQLLAKRDFDAAYEYALPSYRQTHTKEQFRGHFGVAVKWRRTISPAPGTATFPDVSPSFWAFQDIEALAASGITTGFPDGTFRPTASVTRAQVATFFARALGLHWPN